MTQPDVACRVPRQAPRHTSSPEHRTLAAHAYPPAAPVPVLRLLLLAVVIVIVRLYVLERLAALAARPHVLGLRDRGPQRWLGRQHLRW